jgi:SAM-dependent methyltransferase
MTEIEGVPTGRADGPSTMPSSESGWWEEERAKLVAERITDLVGHSAVIADVGCGRGTMLREPTFDEHVVVRVDSHLWDEWRERPGPYVCAAAHALPFRDGTFDVVGSFDVLEHLADDEAALREQRRVTRAGGHVVAAVPADRRLWSAHDEAVGHHRRYDRAGLRALADRCGLIPTRLSAFYSFLWLPAYALRNRAARTAEPGNDDTVSGRLVRHVIGALSRLERLVIRRVRLPVGTSLWAEFEAR